MAEITKMSSKKDKRKSFVDLKATTSTTIEGDAAVSTSSSKPSKKRKNHADAGDLVVVTPANVTVDKTEEPSTKKQKKAKKDEEQDNNPLVESKPEEESTKNRKKDKKTEKRPNQTPTKPEQNRKTNVGGVGEAGDPATEVPAKKKSKKVEAGEGMEGGSVAPVEGESKINGKEARNTGVDVQGVVNQSASKDKAAQKKKKSGEKVVTKADEIAVQPESIKSDQTKQPVVEETAVAERKPKKRKKAEERVKESVDGLVTQPKPAMSAGETAGEGEPKKKKRKKTEGNVTSTEDEVRTESAKSTKTQQPALPSVEGKEAEETTERKKGKKKGKNDDAKKDAKEDDSKPVETPAPKPLAVRDPSKKTKLGPDTSKPAIQVSPMATKSKSISAPRKSTTATSEVASEPTKKSKKAKAKDPSPQPEPSSDDDSDVEGDVQFGSGEDDEVHLHGFSTDDDDSSDEETGMDFESAPLDITKLPTVAKDDAIVKRKLDKAKRQPTEDRGVLFIGRLPHGFYEDQLKGYFSQFGTVTRLRVSRNKKTGRSKHYAFLEFDSLPVAQIVADTMDNYLLMGHILRCKLIPKDEVHPELWIGANRKWRPVPRDRLTRVEHNKPRTADEQARAAKRLIKRQNARKRKLAESGIGYDFDTVSYKKPEV